MNKKYFTETHLVAGHRATKLIAAFCYPDIRPGARIRMTGGGWLRVLWVGRTRDGVRPFTVVMA
jgi:hypothetical protein